MDYRFYRGRGFESTPGITKYLYLLQHVGTLLIALPGILAVSMLLQFLEPNLTLIFVSFIAGTFGSVFFIVGLTFNSTMDRV